MKQESQFWTTFLVTIVMVPLVLGMIIGVCKFTEADEKRSAGQAVSNDRE